VAADSPFDLAVIGAGPGGYVAALRAAQLGLRVACVERETSLGGTCLRVGCIPSKALLESSARYDEARHALAAHGVVVGEVALDLATMLHRKDAVVAQMARGIEGLFKKHGVAHVRGHGRIDAPARVGVTSTEGDRVIDAARILIATGSVPRALRDLPFDGARVVSSTEALAFPEVPSRLIVLGAGAIGLELGSVWRRLGADVLVVELLDRILPGMDRELADRLFRLLARQGLRFELRTRAVAARVDGERVHVRLARDGEEREETCDRLLVAVGRAPCTDGLGLERVGIATDAQGRIPVDARYATAVAGVYAIGDVIAGPMLAHKAEEEGIAAVEMMAGLAAHVNYAAVPYVVYTHPEAASAGLGEDEARAGERAVKVGRFPFAANGRAWSMADTGGFVKVVGDVRTDRLLGVHILGARASDMIAEAALAIELGATVEDLARAVHAHPTLPEAVKEAALAADGRALHA
jgi:dihydrolipoamide dehydrogenase